MLRTAGYGLVCIPLDLSLVRKDFWIERRKPGWKRICLDGRFWLTGWQSSIAQLIFGTDPAPRLLRPFGRRKRRADPTTWILYSQRNAEQKDVCLKSGAYIKPFNCLYNSSSVALATRASGSSADLIISTMRFRNSRCSSPLDAIPITKRTTSPPH